MTKKYALVNTQLQRVQYRYFNISDDLMSRAIQAGNPARLKNVLKKALRGEDINLLVIGGSQSAGGRLGLDENSLVGLYFKVFAKWWNNTFGTATKSFVREIQLGIGSTGSPFFAFCYKTFIAKGEKIDIVLIEISQNDKSYQTAKPLEQLTRQVLVYPSAPAVLYINIVGGLGPDPATKRVWNPSCINLENFGQTAVARHYNITSFSLKEILCRKEKGHWTVKFTNMTGSDGNHIGLQAHALVASMMIEHVRSVSKDCVNGVNKPSINAFEPVAKKESSNLPKPLLIKRETEALKDPLCWTGKTPNAFKDLHHPNLHLEVINKSGFSPCFVLLAQEMNVKKMSKQLRTDTQGGWCAWQNSSTLQLKIYVPVSADDNSDRSRSVIVLTRPEQGKAVIWLDNKQNKSTNSDSPRSGGEPDRVHTIATSVNPGYHTITVKTSRDGMLMVAGVFVGPPDYELM